MKAGENMGIMTTLKKPTAESQGALSARVSSEPQADAPTVARQGAAVRERGAAERLTVAAARPWRAAGERGATLVRPALARWRAGMAAGRVDRLSRPLARSSGPARGLPRPAGRGVPPGRGGALLAPRVGPESRRCSAPARARPDGRGRARHQEGTTPPGQAACGAPRGDPWAAWRALWGARGHQRCGGWAGPRCAPAGRGARGAPGLCLGRRRPPDAWRSLSSPAPGRREDAPRQHRRGAEGRVGPLAASGLPRGRGVWHDPPGAPAAPPAGPAPPARAAAPCRLRPCGSAGGLAPAPGPSARGARGGRGRPGAGAGAPAPGPATIAPGRRGSAARRAPRPARWRGLRRDTPPPEGPPRPAACGRLFPRSGHRGLPLWGRAPWPADAGADRPGGPGGVAGRGARLPPPERLAEASRRRWPPETRATRTPLATMEDQRSQGRQGVARRLDRDAESLLDQAACEPRRTRLRQRLARREAQRQALAAEAAVHGEWPRMMGRREDGATQRHNGLETADGARKRDRIRALGKRVAVTRPEVNGVLRIDPYPRENDPEKKSLQLWRGRAVSPAGTPRTPRPRTPQQRGIAPPDASPGSDALRR